MQAAVVPIRSTLLVVALTMFGLSGFAADAGASAPPTTYYVALGDSLSTGGGATPGHSYVDNVYAHAGVDHPRTADSRTFVARETRPRG